MCSGIFGIYIIEKWLKAGKGGTTKQDQVDDAGGLETRSVLFVEQSRKGELARRLRDVEKKVNRFVGYKTKIMEGTSFRRSCREKTLISWNLASPTRRRDRWRRSIRHRRTKASWRSKCVCVGICSFLPCRRCKVTAGWGLKILLESR